MLAGRFCGPQPFVDKAVRATHELQVFATKEMARVSGPSRKDAQVVLERIREWKAEGTTSVRRTGGAFYRTMWRLR
eukprot:8975341-Lingulodinium_polyedra.AAC.1